MVDSKYKRFTSRIEELIKEYTEEIFPKKIKANWGYSYPDSEQANVQAWLMKSENILLLIFGDGSIQLNRFRSLRDNKKDFDLCERTHQIKGILEACLDDLKNGFLTSQEFIIANEVFDSVLEQAEFFVFKQKDKDVAAILLRIVLEDSLKRISKSENIEIELDGKNRKVSALNDDLKKTEYYNKTTWRQIQAWLDIGNAAAHGEFDKYSIEDVDGFYKWLMDFISRYFN